MAGRRASPPSPGAASSPRPGRTDGGQPSGGRPPASTPGLPPRRPGGRGRPRGPAGVDVRGAGLQAVMRNPAAVRSWPAQQMPAFDAATVGDAEVDAIIDYLRYLGEHLE